MPIFIKKRRLLAVAFVSFLFWILLSQYLFCPSFSFKIPPPFTGSLFYNPYESIVPSHWRKCNFHAHTNAWYGITNGKGTAKNVYHVYDSMNYAVHCVSDYQSINRTFESDPGYIPAYEHGFNPGKTHQLVLGCRETKWLDYLFPQTLDNKQNVLNCLANSDNVVIINHPSSFHGYNAGDFIYLSNYQCIEALSRYAISLDCWDTALSHGKAVFIVGNDDEHNIFSKNCVGKMCTCLNIPSSDQKTVLSALRKGAGYGVIVGNCGKVLPFLNYLKIKGDSIVLNMSGQVHKISFIGQNGKRLATQWNTSTAIYSIKKDDHYIRTVVDYDDGTSIYLNPVFRYE